MHASVDEIAKDVFRINIRPGGTGSVSCFLIRDDLPAMVECGYGTRFGMFEAVRDAVARLIEPTSLRYILVPHVEGDECGALNRFLEIAPGCQPVCSPLGARITIADFSTRTALALGHGESLSLGHKTLRAVVTPWVHFWDSMLVYDETDRVLFTSDLFMQRGAEALTYEDRSAEVVGLARSSGLLPSQRLLESALDRIEPLAVDILAAHHGSVLAGDPTRYYRAVRDNPVGDIVDAPFYETKPIDNG
jgi:flavorubredoxin